MHIGDTVAWSGETGARQLGVLVRFAKSGQPVVRRWVASKRMVGRPHTISGCEPAKDSEWLRATGGSR